MMNQLKFSKTRINCVIVLLFLSHGNIKRGKYERKLVYLTHTNTSI